MSKFPLVIATLIGSFSIASSLVQPLGQSHAPASLNPSMESIDSECRIQAKETAINSYQSCVKDSRTQKIEEIRKEYQSKLTDLKSYYDAEMKKMSSNQKSSDDNNDAPVSVVLKKNSKSSAKAKGLPAKKMLGKSLPVRNIEREVRTTENRPETRSDESVADSANLETSTATEGSSDADLLNP